MNKKQLLCFDREASRRLRLAPSPPSRTWTCPRSRATSTSETSTSKCRASPRSEEAPRWTHPVAQRRMCYWCSASAGTGRGGGLDVYRVLCIYIYIYWYIYLYIPRALSLLCFSFCGRGRWSYGLFGNLILGISAVTSAVLSQVVLFPPPMIFTPYFCPAGVFLRISPFNLTDAQQQQQPLSPPTANCVVDWRLHLQTWRRSP